jgi:hypothetical protein
MIDSPPWLVVGARVDYCSVIGQPATEFNMVVKAAPEQLASGLWVVWIEGKAGCVAVEACLQHAAVT